MVAVQQTAAYEQLLQGISRSKKHTKPILTSIVKKTSYKDPLLFYEAAKYSYVGERFFWTDPSDEIILVGLGTVFSIEAQERRFEIVEEEWERILTNCVKEEQTSPFGTGPILLGGFSFDPLKQSTSLWGKYPPAKFILPEFMLTINKGDAWITSNIICQHSSDPIEILKDLENKMEHILQSEWSWQPNEKKHSYRQTEIEPELWIDSVDSVTQDIKQGELDKVVLARETRLHFDGKVNLTSVLNNLRAEQPMSYIFAFESGEDCFIGASPERLIKKENSKVLSTCLAGSIKRGKTLDEDKLLGSSLLCDKKNLHEHELVVKMIKKAMLNFCSTIDAPSHPTLLKMRHIQHLYTPVICTVKDHVSFLSMVEKLHPTPALGGFPTDKAIKKIREVEQLDRGWYAAPIGWIDANNSGEFAVAIRSALFQGQEASLFAGCGIVADSDPQSEYEETKLKLKPILSAIGGMSNDENEQ
ncbi:isochorismate synthase [Cytobacillus sp. IB215665]|uniref:isochorismate synthase n=1 Tax=Cytobacillus sp. IB215665 TaxID=3097357 RepID=UPI002A0B338E|nr:isochorismate synthase [Cytobacillus sp. IB215665]MDX8367407.1 isochorismate synthase [Cytobacillus sp. IB215665]